MRSMLGMSCPECYICIVESSLHWYVWYAVQYEFILISYWIFGIWCRTSVYCFILYLSMYHSYHIVGMYQLLKRMYLQLYWNFGICIFISQHVSNIGDSKKEKKKKKRYIETPLYIKFSVHQYSLMVKAYHHIWIW